MAVVVGALIGARAVRRCRLPGAVTLEGGERAALVGGDPHVDHRVVATGEHRAGRAVAVGVGDPGDLRAVVPSPPAEVLVDVPLHQPAAKVDELGIVDRTLPDDEHRRHQRALVAVDQEHQRFGLGGVEPHVVVDQRVVDVVLIARAGVADRPVAELVERVDVGERRKLLLRRADEGGRPQPLFGSDAIYVAEINRFGGVVRPRPVHGCGFGNRRRSRLVVGMSLASAVRVVGTDEHRGQRDDPDGERREPEAHRRHRRAPTDEGDQGGDGGDGPERGAGGVGELRVLGDLQPVDPADAPQPSRTPRRNGTEVDEDGQDGSEPATLHEGEQADTELGDGDGDEQPGERDVCGVQAGDSGVDRPGADRRETGELHDARWRRTTSTRRGVDVGGGGN